MDPGELNALLAALRAYGVVKYETPEICVELHHGWSAPILAAGTATESPEEDDFDPAKAYQEAIDEAAKAIAAASEKRS